MRLNQAASRPATPMAALRVAALTAAAYVAVAWLALLLAVPPGYASPLYPSSGIALATGLMFGPAALAGTAVGAFLINLTLDGVRHPLGVWTLLLPVCVGLGAALQAAVGTQLVHRFVSQPLTLDEPRDILRFGVLGAMVAGLVNASLSTWALWAAGTLPVGQIVATWTTWWVGDTLGVLIGAPLALTLIGKPAADWHGRRRTVGVPLLLVSLLLASSTLVISRWDLERLQTAFDRDADRLATEVNFRLRAPLHALQALHSAYNARGDIDQASLTEAAKWWFTQPLELQAMGHSVRVDRAGIAAYEAAARLKGPPDYRIFEREGAPSAASDPYVVAARHIVPLLGNAAALGINALSVPAARAAILGTRDTGQPASSAGFRLTQSTTDETGLVIYQALYDNSPGASGGSAAERFVGTLFVTVRAERLLAGLEQNARSRLRWCLVDPDPGAVRRRLAGTAECTTPPDKHSFTQRRTVEFGGRRFELQTQATLADMAYAGPGDAWLLSVTGLLGASMLGALLLTITGRARRIERAVADRTGELRREVAERTSAEEALRDSETRLRSILDHVPIGVMFLDTAGRVLAANPRLCEMLERPSADMLRSNFSDLSHPDERAATDAQFVDLLSGRTETLRRQMRLLRAGGEVLWVRIEVTALPYGHGHAQRLAGVVEDITDHLRLLESERALDRAEAASRAKSEFVSRMSHELRTPLNAMIGFAQLLGLDRVPALSERQRNWTAEIQRAGWHLLDMINDTLDLARIESGALQLAMRPLDVDAIVGASRAMVANLAAQRSVTLSVVLDPAAGSVLGDETRLKQVLTNLLSNAVKYNRERGTVRVISRLNDEGGVDIAVEDSGVGMSTAQQDALFQPYNRLGREHSGIEGTGIGLVISKRLTELMGGHLSVQSVVGVGSTFTVHLPRAEVESQPSTASTAVAERAGYRRRRVHYIEDNETNVEVMRGILLQREQIELSVSMMGLEGLEAVTRDRPHLLLLDMQLPDISGLELLARLKANDDTADIPVIVVSADATSDRMERALTLGAAHYITKPVDVERFLQTVDQVLGTVETRWGM